MPTQSNFSGGRGGGISWGSFLDGLQQGSLWAYLMLIALVAIATIAFWAGGHVMRGGTRR